MVTADPWLRWTRAAALATVASLVAVWAHVGADGRLPSAPVLLAIAAALTVAARPLLARPSSSLRVVLMTVGGQAVAHAALSLAAGHHGDPAPAAPAPPPPTPVPLALDEHGRRVGSLLDHARPAAGVGDGGLSVPDPVAHLVGDLSAAGAPMLAAHLAAAVVVGVWLAVGERALWTLLSLVWRALSLPAPVLPVPSLLAGRRAGAPAALAPVRLRLAVGSVVRRGPPLLLAA